jgi:hypothetical protein
MPEVTIDITLPQDQWGTALAKLDRQTILGAIKRGMDRGVKYAEGQIIAKRLTGQGPFPPSEHRLGVRTGRLRASVRSTAAVIAGDIVTASIGSDVVYAPVHEFGFTGTVRGRSGRSRSMRIPERAPFRIGLQENLDYITNEIGDEIQKELGDAQ